jgi:hypothetical protein
MQETGSRIAQLHDEDGAAPRSGVLEDIVQQLIGQPRTEPGARTSITDATAPASYEPGSLPAGSTEQAAQRDLQKVPSQHPS